MPRRLSAAGCLVALGLLLAGAPAGALTPPFEVLRDGLKPSNVILLDRENDPIAETFKPYQGLRLEWTPLRTLPAEMLHTLLVAEDQRFFEHAGVDWRAFVAALWQNLWHERKRGASTLSMQLAGLLDPALHPSAEHGGRRTIAQKWDQSLAARELEAGWSKEQILEGYLNLVYFRGRLQGIAAAAWGLFDKPPVLLTRAEAATLAALLRGPNASPATVQRRACVLLERVAAGEECAELEDLGARLQRAGVTPRWDLAPALLRRAGGSGGARIASTLDHDWQSAANEALRELPPSRSAALVVLGQGAQVLAYAGEPRVLEESYPASGVELPLSLARALEEGRLTAASLLLAPNAGSRSEQPWISTRSAMSSADPDHRTALASALSNEATHTRATLVELGAIANGEAGVLAVGAMYAALAGDGRWQAPRWRGADPAPAPHALSSRAGAFIAADLLSPRPSPGCARAYHVEHAQGSWLGAVIGEYALALRIDGGRGAGEALAVLDALAASAPARAACTRLRSPPEQILKHTVSFEPAAEPARAEWFIRGSSSAISRAPLNAARITWPRAQSIVDARQAGEDPHFRIFFEAYPALPALRWLVNGVEVGRGGRVSWRPRAGLIQLELVTPEGELIDRVEFAARGPL